MQRRFGAAVINDHELYVRHVDGALDAVETSLEEVSAVAGGDNDGDGALGKQLGVPNEATDVRSPGGGTGRVFDRAADRNRPGRRQQAASLESRGDTFF